VKPAVAPTARADDLDARKKRLACAPIALRGPGIGHFDPMASGNEQGARRISVHAELGARAHYGSAKATFAKVNNGIVRRKLRSHHAMATWLGGLGFRASPRDVPCARYQRAPLRASRLVVNARAD